MFYNVNVVLTNGGSIGYNVSETDAFPSIINIHLRYSVKSWTAKEVQHLHPVQPCEYCDRPSTFVTVNDTALCQQCADDADLERA